MEDKRKREAARTRDMGPKRRGRKTKGILLVGLLVAVAISSILLAVPIPSWQAQAQRDREEELIFRGEAYAEAIRRFQLKMGHLPVKLEDLHKKPQQFIRRLYKDPVTKDEDGNWGGEFGLVHASPTGQPILPGQPTGGGLPGSGGLPGGSGGPTGGAATKPGSIGTPPTKKDAFGTPQSGGPIIGVYSLSDEESIKIYDGKTHYNEWYFVMKPPQQGKRGGPGATAPGGNPPGGPPGRR